MGLWDRWLDENLSLIFSPKKQNLNPGTTALNSNHTVYADLYVYDKISVANYSAPKKPSYSLILASQINQDYTIEDDGHH